jgi:hypothetical protein
MLHPGREKRPFVIMLLTGLAWAGTSPHAADGADAWQPAPWCRTYATAMSSVSTASGFTATVEQTCAFAAATTQATCTGEYKDARTSSTTTSTTTFASLADAVDEVRVIPPLTVNGGLLTTVGTFDANGNLTRHATTGGGTTSETIITIKATARVCK